MTLPVEDVKALRKMAADYEFQKARADEAESQLAAWQKSSADWRALYLSEKDRADRVQGGRIDESAGAISDLQKANAEYKSQATSDRQKIAEQNAEIIKLKSGRKWWFAAGAAAGGVGGYFVGNRTAKAGGIVNVITGTPAAPAGFTLRF